MSENTNDFLNDFLGSSEGNGGSGFADLTLPDFEDSVAGDAKTKVEEIPPETPKEQEPAVQSLPQTTMFDEALKQTPAMTEKETQAVATSFEDLVAKAQAQRDNEMIANLAAKNAIFSYGSATIHFDTLMRQDSLKKEHLLKMFSTG